MIEHNGETFFRTSHGFLFAMYTASVWRQLTPDESEPSLAQCWLLSQVIMVIKVALLKFYNMNIHNNGGMALAIIATAISPFPNYTQYQTKATL